MMFTSVEESDASRILVNNSIKLCLTSRPLLTFITCGRCRSPSFCTITWRQADAIDVLLLIFRVNGRTRCVNHGGKRIV